MQWKVDALIETRFVGPVDETEARKKIQSELWRLVESLEVALGNELSTSIHILGCEAVEIEGST